MSSLIYLDLSNNSFNASSLEALISSLPLLQYLILRNCAMNISYMTRLLRMVCRTTVRLFQLLGQSPLLSKSLVKLDISENTLSIWTVQWENSVDIEGSEALTNWIITRAPYTILESRMENRTQLRQLDIAKCQVYFSPLIKALSKDEIHINSLDISGNLISEDAFMALNPLISSGKIQFIGLGNMKVFDWL